VLPAFAFITVTVLVVAPVQWLILLGCGNHSPYERKPVSLVNGIEPLEMIQSFAPFSDCLPPVFRLTRLCKRTV
jgi:hypothetical protein